MEHQSTGIPMNTKDNESELKWFLHNSRLLEKESSQIGVDKFWEGQWSSQIKDWAPLNKQAQVMDHNMAQSCDSPSASESSSSLSNRESSSFSGKSETSSIVGKNLCRSPELLSTRFSGFSLFNPEINHLVAVSKVKVGTVSSKKFINMDEQQEQMLDQERGLSGRLAESNQHVHCCDLDYSGPLDSEFDTAAKVNKVVPGLPDGQIHSTQDYFDEGWVSDSSGTQSWASASSQELSWKHPYDGADEVQLQNSLIEHEHSAVCCSTEFGNNINERHGDDVLLRQGQPASSRAEVRNSIRHPLQTNHHHDTAEMHKSKSHEEILSGDGNIYESDPWHPALDDIGGATTAVDLIPSSSIFLAKLQVAGALSTSQPSKVRFESENSYMLLTQDSGPDPHIPGASVLSKPQVSDAYCKRHVTRSVTGPCVCELPEYVTSGHKTAKFLLHGSLRAGGMTKHPSHAKSKHSAAVKDRFPSSSVHGYFRFAEQGGSLCYSFYVNDSDEVFFARSCRAERRSNKEKCDWMYTFYSRRENGKAKGAWKGWPKKENLASDLVGKMRVSNVKHSNINCTQTKCTKETHFILFDDRGQQHPKSQATRDDTIQGQPAIKPLKPVFESLVTPPASTLGAHLKHLKQKDELRGLIPDANQSHGSIGPGLNEANIRDRTLKNDPVNLVDVKNAAGSKGFVVELAAIVITSSVIEQKMAARKDSKSSQKETAGWGAKFLEKGSDVGWGLSFLEKPSDNGSNLEVPSSLRASDSGRQLEHTEVQATGYACQSDIGKLQDDRAKCTKPCSNPYSSRSLKLDKKLRSSKDKHSKMKVDVTLILPAGDHGLPRDDDGAKSCGNGGGSHGPTPLLERWRSGGDCDCGGWDMGCGLSVLKADTLTLHGKGASIALTRHDRMNWISPRNPLKIFTQGYKRKKVLVLEIIQTGQFSLSFQARFSPLQAFATAVAMFHQQITQK